MAAKRIRQRGDWGGLLRGVDAEGGAEPPSVVTCPACGASAEIADHYCPRCGELFYERPRGKVGRGPRNGPPRDEPEIAEFARRMDRVEGWTRLACVIAAMLFGLMALACLATMPIGFGFRGAEVLGVLSVVCFVRGLKGGDADTSSLSDLPRVRTPLH